jgi:hypothetical protein
VSPESPNIEQKALGELLSSAEQRLWNALEESKAFHHPTLKGDARENALRSFLDGQLPDRFGVTSGEAIDIAGRRSGQIDLIVYDRFQVGPFFTVEQHALLPIEAVLATIEMKTTLDDNAAKHFAEGVRKLHELRPYGKPFGFARTGGAPGDSTPRVQSTLLAYRSSYAKKNWAEAELSRIRRLSADTGCDIRALDRVVVLERGLLLPIDGEVIRRSNERGVLRFWFFHLVNYLSREAERRRGFPWDDYADPEHRWSRERVAESAAPGRSSSPKGPPSRKTARQSRSGARRRKRRHGKGK